MAIGGGHGLNRSLRALTHAVDHVTAVVTAADDGGSSGRLRRTMGVVPPGDLRMALAALSPRAELVELLQFRFDDEAAELAGHSLGNLIIVAAASLSGGDLVAGLDRVATTLGCRGRVLPCSLEPLHLHATVDGSDITGQVRVTQSQRVERVWIEPAAPEPCPSAIRAIERADLVVLGPGSLYTSLIPNLLVPGIADAVRARTGPTVLVANIREQPGETEGMELEDHLDALRQHVPDLPLTAVIAHEGPAPANFGRALKADPAVVAAFGADTVTADLLDGRDGHDPIKLAGVLGRVLRGGRSEAGGRGHP
ncbi:MAG TPA: gluconeogenesis factor YvcK family protein [Nitriliruptorales bacterium]